VLAAKQIHPDAKVLVHPECRPEVLEYADYMGSTAGILKEAQSSDAREFIIGTEMGIVEKLNQTSPGKRFYPMTNHFLCPNMKKTRLSDVKNALLYNQFAVNLEPSEMAAARKSLERMVAVKV